MMDYSKFRDYNELRDFVIKEGKARNRTEAAKHITKTMPKESYFQTKIIKALKKAYPDSVVEKYSAGAYSTGGIPDILFIHKGRYYGFEVKRPFIGVVSKLQEQAIQRIRKAGGVAEVVCFPEEVLEIIEKTDKE